MIEWLITFLVFYFLYKLIFDFILPVSRASSQIKNRMNQMHQQQQNVPSLIQTEQPGPKRYLTRQIEAMTDRALQERRQVRLADVAQLENGCGSLRCENLLARNTRRGEKTGAQALMTGGDA